jgi:hypothetical protein
MPLLILPPQIELMREVYESNTVKIHLSKNEKRQRRFTETLGEKQIFNLLSQNLRR